MRRTRPPHRRSAELQHRCSRSRCCFIYAFLLCLQHTPQLLITRIRGCYASARPYLWLFTVIVIFTVPPAPGTPHTGPCAGIFITPVPPALTKQTSTARVGRNHTCFRLIISRSATWSICQPPAIQSSDIIDRQHLPHSENDRYSSRSTHVYHPAVCPKILHTNRRHHDAAAIRCRCVIRRNWICTRLAVSGDSSQCTIEQLHACCGVVTVFFSIC